MRLSLTSNPANLPLEWEDEVETHLRVDSTDEQTRVMTVVVPAVVDWVEAQTNRACITQTYRMDLPGFPGAAYDEQFGCDEAGVFIRIPKPPLSSITYIKYIDADGVLQTWSSSKYLVDSPAGPQAPCARVYLAYNEIWPTTRLQYNAVQITFICGYGSTGESVPGALRQAMLLILGEQYERREEGNELEITRVPVGALSLIANYEVH